MPTENRTRVEIFLPVRSDHLAYQSALDWLAEEFAFARGGSTFTTPFAGLYSTATGGELVQDSIRVLFCDFNWDISIAEDRHELDNYLTSVRSFLMAMLEEEEVWIVYHSVSRIVS
ncbi:MAG: hypothetical protein ABR530_10645 [Pyrinomonadaceae bacterium]